MKKDLTNVIGYIYKITSPNGKVYIGQTINKKQRRYHYNSNSFKLQIKLWNNTQKHNWNPADTFEIIEECLCGENKYFLNEREKYWIEFYDSYKNGLNCNKGGYGNSGYIASDETKQKMSSSHKNKPPMSDSTKQLLRELNLGGKTQCLIKYILLNQKTKLKTLKLVTNIVKKQKLKCQNQLKINCLCQTILKNY